MHRSQIRKGVFLTSDPCPPGYVPRRREPSVDELSEIKAQHAATVDELTRRLQAVRKSLDDIRARGRK